MIGANRSTGGFSNIRVGWKCNKYNKNVASYRLRGLEPMRQLSRIGLSCEAYEPGRHYDIVILQKAYSEPDLALVKSLAADGIATIFDLSDNHWYNPDDRPDFAARIALLDEMIREVNLVTVPTSELKRRVRGNLCLVVDDAGEKLPRNIGMPESRHTLGRNPARGLDVRLVWFGHAGLATRRFGMMDVSCRLNELNAFHRKQPVTLTIVSNSQEAFDTYTRDAEFPVHYVPWNIGNISDVLREHDICILPINRNPFTDCKSPNRLVFALRLGLPVVADTIPSYREFSRFVILDDWQGGLDVYANRPEVRDKHLEEAWRYISKRYTNRNLVEQWLSAIRKAIEDKP